MELPQPPEGLPKAAGPVLFLARRGGSGDQRGTLLRDLMAGEAGGEG